MAAFYKNTSVEVALPEGQGDVQPAVTRLVNLQPGTSTLVYETFGVEADVKWMLYDDAEGAPYYKEGGRVTIDGKAYAITIPPSVWNVLPQASHVVAALTEIR